MAGSLVHFGRLVKAWRRRGRSQEEAEDLIQEAFLRLHEYSRACEVRDEEAFLARTVSNLAINEYHRKRTAGYPGETLEELERSASLIDSGPGPERVLAAQQRLDEIAEMLRAASERTCAIFIAQRSGYTYDEIAASLGISERTVQKHIARAMFLLMRMGTVEQE
jgi:RNA polymerase sigma-70 factor (ECF subfamily)